MQYLSLSFKAVLSIYLEFFTVTMHPDLEKGQLLPLIVLLNTVL